MAKIKEDDRFYIYFYVMFSDKVKTNEQLINMMMNKLSYDCRVEEWGYIQNPENTISKLTDNWEREMAQARYLRDDLARCKKERDKSKELALEVMKLFACDLLDGDMPTDADLNNLQRKFAEVGLEDEFDLIFAC
jgi:hypothetical protein